MPAALAVTSASQHGNQVGRCQVVGDDLQHRCGAEFAGVQDAPAHRRQHRQDALEDIALAAGKDGNVAGGGPMTAAGYRAVNG